MILYLKIAWRNIWRNKRRTSIAISSIFFAIILAIITRSMQFGSYDFMIDSAVRLYTGYIQIHQKNYWDERSLEKSFVLDKNLLSKIESIKYVDLAVPRLENYMLISSNDVTKIAAIICIDPEKENKMTRLKDRLISGRYLSKNDEGILISEGLAKIINITIDDSVILYGQGIYGITAAVNCKIIGIVKFALPDLNNTFVYLPLKYGQSLFSMEDKITTISIMINNPKKINFVISEIKKLVNNELEVMSWDIMMPELVQGIQLDNVGGIIMLFILYLVITFGIFGTVIMMTTERTKEFGILISIGMKKSKLIFITFLEVVLISFIGALTGLLVSIPITIYFHHNPLRFSGEIAEISLKFGVEPIIPFSTDVGIYIAQTLVVFVIAIFTTFYPFNYIRKLQPSEAIRI